MAKAPVIHWSFDAIKKVPIGPKPLGLHLCTTKDVTGNGNDGLLKRVTGECVFHPSVGDMPESKGGKVGGALLFHGQDCVELAENKPAVRLQGAMTVAAWVNRYGVWGWQYVAAKGNWDEPAHGFGLALWCRRPYFWVGVEGQRARQAVWSDGELTLNEWYHIAGVFEPCRLLRKRGAARVVPGYVKLYVNGCKDPKSTGIMVPGPMSLTRGQAFAVGAAPYYYSNQWGGPFIGLIDDVRLYDRALSEKEIQGLTSA
jgi:hypothetical protein